MDEGQSAWAPPVVGTEQPRSAETPRVVVPTKGERAVRSPGGMRILFVFGLLAVLVGGAFPRSPFRNDCG